MGKKFFSLCMALALCLGLLPVTALAAGGAPSQLYVGNQQVISGNDITYWTTDASGGLGSASGDSWNVKYDPTCATLTLNGATIKGGSDVASIPYGSGIYAQVSSNQPVTLTIELIGENTITGTFGIYVNATPPTTPGTDASLVIKKSGDNGSLTVTGTDSYGLYIASGTGNASLTIKNVSVVANATSSYSGSGVCVQSGASATDSPNISLSVDGGSLTASGTGSNDGILFYVGQSQATGATTSLTVSENAIVDARNGGIKALKISETLPTPTPTGNNSSGIVFDRTEGTVYGNVELQKDLEIKSGETLTVPEGSSLNCNGKLTNNGTILASGGTVTGSLSGGSTVTTPNITVQPSDNTVTEGQGATFTVEASAGSETPTYQWQQSTDSGSNWTNIESATSAKYTTEATTISMSGYQYRCVVKSASGVSVISNAATLTVNAAATTITTQPSNVTVTEGETATFSVTATGSNLTYQWQQSTDGSAWANISGATSSSYTTQAATMDMDGWQYRCVVTDGNSNGVTSQAATLTVTAATVSVTGVTLNKTSTSLYVGDTETLTATVEPSDATNKNVTWNTSDTSVATVNNGVVTAVSAGTATITVTTADGGFTDTCTVTVTARTYNISAAPGRLDFGSANVGYETAPAAQTVTITNTGNQSVTLYQPTAENYEIGTLTNTTLTPGAAATFTVQPKTGLGVGTYRETITVSGSNGASASLTASFTVNAIPVTSVTLSQTQASLYCNRTPNTITLTATVAPDNATNQAVTWTSSDSTVATVDQNGVVTAVAPGTAVITAAAADGSGASASCTVTVSRYSSGGGSSSSSTSLSDRAIDDIQDARPGDTVEITLRPGRTTLEREVFEALAGQDITLEIDAGDGVLWTVNGLDIPEDTRLHDLDLDVDLGDSDIPATVLNAVTGEIGTVQLSLAHDGEFGFTMTLSAPLGRDNADYWANLYWYNEETEELEFQQAARIAEEGTAEFAMDHASDYAIVIDDRSHEPVDLPFNDVPEGYWAYGAIQYVYGEGLMAGTSGSTFNPEGTTTRGQIVTILWRLSGSPVVNYLMGFDGVGPAAY